MRQATQAEIEALQYSKPFLDGRLKLFYTGSDDEFMEAARLVLQESTDQRHPTASVVVKDGVVLSMDANQSGYKNPFLIKWHQTWFCIRRWFKVKSGTHYWLCRGCAKSFHHAESRAARAAFEKHGHKAMNSTLYLFGHWWCCEPCCNEMIKAGVTSVVLLEGAKDAFLGGTEKYRAK